MKIPFERTIASAYRFAFTNILSVIGVGWFPVLLLSLLVGGLIYMMLPQLTEFGTTFLAAASGDKKAADPAHVVTLLGSLAGSYFLIIIAVILTQAMINVGLMRKALGLHEGPIFFFFSLGSQVWRLIGSYLLLVLLAWAYMFLCIVACFAIYAGLAQASQGGAIAAVVFIAIFAGLFLIYAAVRISFFIPPVVVAENHIGIRRAWHLGYGNFWRILGILLIVTLPLSMAGQTIMTSLMQIALGPDFGANMGPAASPEEGMKQAMAAFQAIGRMWPYFVGVQLVSMILQAGLTTGAAANAYKFVTGAADPNAPATQAQA